MTVQRARSRKTAASLKLQALRGGVDKDEYVFTDNPPSSTERAKRQWLTPGYSLTIQRQGGYNKFNSDCKPPAAPTGVSYGALTSLGTRSSSDAMYDVMKFVRLITVSLTSGTHLSSARRWFS